MCADGTFLGLPSFFVECLVSNCPDEIFRDTWTNQVRHTLAAIYGATDGAEPPTESGGRWLEVNRAKYLFHPSQAWTRSDAHKFALMGWNYLGFS